MISLLMIPETGEITLGEYLPAQPASSAMDAVTQGTSEGIRLYLNIIAMLIVLIALVALGNQVHGAARGGRKEEKGSKRLWYRKQRPSSGASLPRQSTGVKAG